MTDSVILGSFHCMDCDLMLGFHRVTAFIDRGIISLYASYG